jgi:hypothetical protein
MMKVVLYRGIGTNINLFNGFVVQYEGKVVDLLESSEYNVRYMHAFMLMMIQPDASVGLTDKKGNPVPAKMKIHLSSISASVDGIKEFMEKVDADVRRLSGNDAVAGTVSTLGQVLQVTKTIMDQVSQVRHWCLRLLTLIVNRLIVVIRHTRYSTYRGPLFPVFTR